MDYCKANCSILIYKIHKKKAAESYPRRMPSVSKKHLATRMKRKTLRLNEKIKLIDFEKKASHLRVPKTWGNKWNLKNIT